ncbi:MAG: preprotein translocase subunit YajC [Planctomycetia bacterium]|nr:preprotein translocase subunit YajC [Planctomycetia bacterium]
MAPLLPAFLAQTSPPAEGTPSTSAPPGGAPSGSAPAGDGMGGLGSILLPIGLMFAVMYFLMIRPQQKKEKELREMVNRLKKNDKVILQGGIFAVVAQVREKDVIVKIDEKNDVRVRVLKSSVLGVEGKSGEAEAKPDAASADDAKTEKAEPEK